MNIIEAAEIYDKWASRHPEYKFDTRGDAVYSDDKKNYGSIRVVYSDDTEVFFNVLAKAAVVRIPRGKE